MYNKFFPPGVALVAKPLAMATVITDDRSMRKGHGKDFLKSEVYVKVRHLIV